MVMEMFLIRYIMYLIFVLLSECSNSLVLFLFNLFPVPFESSPTYHLFGFAALESAEVAVVTHQLYGFAGVR